MVAIIIADFQNFSTFTFLCFFTILCYSLFFRKTKKSPLGFDLPPSPPSLPIIGHLHYLLSGLPHKSFQTLSSKYGPFLYLRVFSFPIVLVSSASIASEIFKTNDANVSSRGVVPKDESLVFGSSGFLTAPYGDYWRFMKKLLSTKLLRPQAIDLSRGIRSEELRRFCLNLLDKARKKESVVIATEAMKLVNNNMCRMSLGRSFSEDNGESEKVRELTNKAVALTKKMFLGNMFSRALGFSPFKKEIMEVSNGFDELLERVMVEHEEKFEGHQDKDMMDLLLEAYRNEEAEYKITRNQIKALFTEIFVGGIDTSVQTIQWTMAEILNNPNIFKKLREEIDRVVGKTRLIQESDFPNLPFLEAVVKEGLRLHPPGPLMVRLFQESCEIKGFYIPEKATLVVNSYAVMRDPNSWEDPDMFKPERFLASLKSGEGDEAREQVMKYLPFGAGRRGCPGSKLGYLSVETAIGAMVQCFDWRIEGEKINMDEVISGLNLVMSNPLNCTPVVRLDPSSF